MNDIDIERYWAGLPVLDHLAEGGAALTSEEVRAALGAKSVQGIGAAFSQTRQSLASSGIRLDEAVRRRTVRRRSQWCAGPRIAQARHVLQRERRRWRRGEREGGPALATAPSGHRGPVLVLRALKTRAGVYRVDGPLDELETLLDDAGLVFGDEAHDSLGEIFIERIEPDVDGAEHPVPDGYGENGIWTRGRQDYAHPQVAGGIGRGTSRSMIACIAEARWVERRIMLTDAIEQVETVIAQDWLMPDDMWARWQEVDDERFRYIEWVGTHSNRDARNAPPLRMRLRCWYEIVIETGASKRVVLREEGLRGDDARTASRAIERWRQGEHRARNELVVVREVRIAKQQPRPMP